MSPTLAGGFFTSEQQEKPFRLLLEHKLLQILAIKT